MVVDNEADNIKFLAKSLVEIGFDVTIIENPKKVFTHIYQSTPDILLLDIMMPHLNGFTLCRNLKRFPKTKDIPIIFLFTLGEKIDKQKGIQLGGLDFIQKPIYLEDAISKIQTYLNLQIIEKKLVALNNSLQYEKGKHIREEASKILSIRYEEILDAVPDIILEMNIDKVITWTNLAGYRFYGEDVVGKGALDYFISVEDTRDLIKPIFEGGENVIYVESWQRRRDGEARLLAWWYRVIRDKEGEIMGAISTGRDITEHIMSKKSLKEAEQELHKLSRAVEQSANVVVITDLAGNIEFVNPAFEKITGYNSLEVIGKNPRILSSGKVSKEIFKNLWDTIQDGKVWKGELINKKKNGELYWEFVTISPVRNKKREVTNYLAIKEDITDRKKSEDILRKTDERIKTELVLARETQFSLLPPPKPNFPNLHIICHTYPAYEVGGDFYSYYFLERKETFFKKNRYIVAVGDVSGKGVSAALLMSTCLAQLESQLPSFISPKSLLQELDKTIMPYAKPRNYNCALCCVQIDIINNDKALLTIANAGCIPPYIKRKNGNVEWNMIGGFALGQGLGLKYGYKEINVHLFKGDMLIMCSDGLIEAMNINKEILGFDNLFKIIKEGPISDSQEMLDHLLKEVHSFTKNIELQDDLTIIVLRL